MDNDRGQSLITKYVWVIETIYRRRKISFKELNELWLRDDISRGVDIPKRTFDNWRYVIWDMFGINIANEGRGEYRYYIENEEDISKNGLRSWLYNTFCVSNALANSQSIKDRIILEYVPSGQDYLQQHDLSQLLEGRGKQLRCAAVLCETIPATLVLGGSKHLFILLRERTSYLRTRPHQISSCIRRNIRDAQGLDCREIL